MVRKKDESNIDKSLGQVFTPNHVAKFMVKNCVNVLTGFGNNNSLENLKVLEPSVGKGVFLKYLVRNGFRDIVAYEIDQRLTKDLLENYPEAKFKFENALGSDLKDKFDLVIGNPPYLGQNYNAEIFQDLVNKFPICEKYFVGNMDLFYYFVHLGILKLNPGGILSFITTDYWITKSEKTGIKYLKPHVLEECYLLQYVDLSNLKLFQGAKGQHNCIFTLQKKTKEEKHLKIDKNIHVMQARKNLESVLSDHAFNKKLFTDLFNNTPSTNIRKYKSALKNNDLKRVGNWNLPYPEEIKKVVDKIEQFCKINGKTSYLKDFFTIRNGLIFIKDQYFILREGKELKIENGDYFIKIKEKFQKISENERNRLKKIYKSKSIKPYGYVHDDHVGHAVFLNKNQYKSLNIHERNKTCEKLYPLLTTYLKQFESDLKDILTNARENPLDKYYPRRGIFIRKKDGNNKEKLVDLENFYEKEEKIFLKYISSENIFGYTDSSYYATSDTYFLWPNVNREIDYLFIIAYLNSKIVNFLFKAKNLKIKRSKTKLEQELPLPNLNNFNSNGDFITIELIKFFSSCLIDMNQSDCIYDVKSSIEKYTRLLIALKYDQDEGLNREVKDALKKKHVNFIQNTIDTLFFRLFSLEQINIESLIKEHYHF